MKSNGNAKKTPQSAPAPDSKVRAVLHELIETCPHPSRLVELYYWSAEPELLETLHRFLSLPEAPHQALRAFLAMVADCPDSVSVAVSRNGTVTLSSLAVAQLMNTMESTSADTGSLEAKN